MIQGNDTNYVNTNIQGKFRPRTGPGNPIRTDDQANHNEGKEKNFTTYAYVGHRNYPSIGAMLTHKDQIVVQVGVKEFQPGIAGVTRVGYGTGEAEEEAAASAVIAAATLGQIVSFAIVEGEPGAGGIEFKLKSSGNRVQPVRVGYGGTTMKHYISAAIEGINRIMPYVNRRRHR